MTWSPRYEVESLQPAAGDAVLATDAPGDKFSATPSDLGAEAAQAQPDPLAVRLQGGFGEERYTITFTDGSRHELAISADIDLLFKPASPLTLLVVEYLQDHA